jgi:hypothetical protein
MQNRNRKFAQEDTDTRNLSRESCARFNLRSKRNRRFSRVANSKRRLSFQPELGDVLKFLPESLRIRAWGDRVLIETQWHYLDTRKESYGYAYLVYEHTIESRGWCHTGDVFVTLDGFPDHLTYAEFLHNVDQGNILTICVEEDNPVIPTIASVAIQLREDDYTYISDIGLSILDNNITYISNEVNQLLIDAATVTDIAMSRGKRRVVNQRSLAKHKYSFAFKLLPKPRTNKFS